MKTKFASFFQITAAFLMIAFSNITAVAQSRYCDTNKMTVAQTFAAWQGRYVPDSCYNYMTWNSYYNKLDNPMHTDSVGGVTPGGIPYATPTGKWANSILSQVSKPGRPSALTTKSVPFELDEGAGVFKSTSIYSDSTLIHLGAYTADNSYSTLGIGLYWDFKINGMGGFNAQPYSIFCLPQTTVSHNIYLQTGATYGNFLIGYDTPASTGIGAAATSVTPVAFNAVGTNDTILAKPSKWILIADSSGVKYKIPEYLVK